MNAPTDKTTAIALAAAEAPLASIDTSTAALILSDSHLGKLIMVAEMMATGRATVPKHFHGNKGDCLAVCMQATQWGMNPFAVAQKTFLVQGGVLGYEAQLIVSAINTSRALVGRLHWEWFGEWERIVGKFKMVESKTKKDDDGHPKKYIVPAWDFDKDEEGLGVIVRGTLRGESQPRELTLLMKQARTRNSTLWTEDPKQQLAYLASKRWGRLYTPEVILGVYSPEELEQLPPKDMGEVEIVGSKTLDAQLLAEWRAAAEKGTKEATKHWRAMSKDVQALATAEQKTEMWEIATKADRSRTVDANAATTPTAAAAPPAARSPATAAAAADGDGVVDDDFVRQMNAAEKTQGGA